MSTTRFIAAAVLVGSLSLASCGGSNSATTVIGSGNARTETRAVSSFSEIALDGIGTVIVRQGTSENLRVEADDNILPFLSTTVNQNRLRIAVSDTTVRLNPIRPIYFYLGARQVSALHLSGHGDIQAPNLRTAELEIRIDGAGTVTTDGLHADTLTVGISGSGDYTGAGVADSQHVSITGTGTYRAKQLKGTHADVSVAGVGNVTVGVSTSLYVEITGTGTVLYVGNPEVQHQISGTGTVAQTA